MADGRIDVTAADRTGGSSGYADDFVVLVDSTCDGASDDVDRLREEITDILRPLGLRLSPAKTRSCTCRRGSTS